MRHTLFVLSATLAISATVHALSMAQRAPAARPNAVTVCEDGGGVGWWRPAKDLLEIAQNEIATLDGLRSAPLAVGEPRRSESLVRPPVQVSNVHMEEGFERARRVCATFTEARRAASPLRSIKVLVTDSITFCQESAHGSWEVGLTKLLEKIANGEITRTLSEDTPVLVFDASSRDLTPAIGLRGEDVRIGGQYVTDVELVPYDKGQPSVCASFAN
jgi:hypothetical protein